MHIFWGVFGEANVYFMNIITLNMQAPTTLDTFVKKHERAF